MMKTFFYIKARHQDERIRQNTTALNAELAIREFLKEYPNFIVTEITPLCEYDAEKPA